MTEVLTNLGPEAILLIVKVTLALVAGYLGWRLCRERGAAGRYAVLAGTIAVLLALPVFSLVLPNWEIATDKFTTRDAAPSATGGVPTADVSSSVGQNIHQPERLPPETRESTLPEVVPFAANPAPTSASSVARNGTLGTVLKWIPAVWAAGSLLMGVWLATGFWTVWRTVREARSLDPRSARRAELGVRLAAELELDRYPQMLESERASTPFAWGLLRPVAVLPAESTSWTDDELRSVLTHELSHHKRRDSLGQLAAVLAQALYWFHPGVWYVTDRLRREAELACDRLVVEAGFDRSTYASCLLALVRRGGNRRSGAGPTGGQLVGFAGFHRLGERIRELLDPTPASSSLAGRDRLSISVLAILLGAGLAVPELSHEPNNDGQVVSVSRPNPVPASVVKAPFATTSFNDAEIDLIPPSNNPGPGALVVREPRGSSPVVRDTSFLVVESGCYAIAASDTVPLEEDRCEELRRRMAEKRDSLKQARQRLLQRAERVDSIRKNLPDIRARMKRLDARMEEMADEMDRLESLQGTVNSVHLKRMDSLKNALGRRQEELEEYRNSVLKRTGQLRRLVDSLSDETSRRPDTVTEGNGSRR